MPYANTAAVSRPEISAFLEEARDLEKMFIAEKVSPIHTVKARAGRYPRIRIDKGQLMKRDSTLRGPTGTYNEIARKFEYDTYDCEDRGLTERVDDANAAEMKDFFDMEVTTAKQLMRAMMIDREILTAELVFDPAMFNSTNGTVAYTEANLATFDFALDLTNAQARLEAKAVMPNTLIISRLLWNRVRRSEKLQTYLFNNLDTKGKRLINPQDIAQDFGIENVHIAKANYDSANRAKSAIFTPIWNNSYFWLGKVEGGDFQNGGATRTIVWGADSPGGLYTSETWREEDRRGDMLRVRTHTAEKVIDNTCAELVATQWA